MCRAAAPAVGWGLFVRFFRREATTRYLGSVTGLAWALVHPIALLAVYHFVFTSIFRATGFAGSSFLAFVAVALWPWLAAQEAIQRAAVCVPGYGGLIRKVAFPHEVVVYASVAATLALHFAGYVVVLAVLRAIGEPIHLEGLLLAIPLWWVMAIAVPGIALALAALLEGRIAPEAGDLAALAVALALFAAGRWTFRRLSPHFEDFV